MAKIVATYDSESKDLSVTIDGVSKGPVESASFEVYEFSDGTKEGYATIHGKAEEVNGVTYMNKCLASETQLKEDFAKILGDKLKK